MSGRVASRLAAVRVARRIAGLRRFAPRLAAGRLQAKALVGALEALGYRRRAARLLEAVEVAAANRRPSVNLDAGRLIDETAVYLAVLEEHLLDLLVRGEEAA